MSTEAALLPLVNRLRAWGLQSLAAAMLEQAEPVTFLGAQTLYLAAPVLRLVWPGDWATDWARLLEDPAAAQALARQLEDA